MSVTVENGKGVTVITVLGDKNSMLPPVCQILKALCYSPKFWSAKSRMMQTGVTAALGTIQIMVGLLSIGLGPGRTSMHPEDFAHLGVAYWLGGVFLVSGLTSVHAGWFSSVCSVGFAVFMNIVGAIFSIVGIVMYSIDLSETNDFYLYDMRELYRRLVSAMDITMIILTVLQLCVCISFAVLGIKALINRKKEEDAKSAEDQLPQLEKVPLTSPGA
ncbi:membrane-spanning 4-domains subfamily A member 15-like [Notolabrus celidotus]|uniref:membrane-spanning 4-domains subfamily A member 15-like n=1 Tax=Notolabrus celidotus TaxID=1203425 RepID=UPI0014906A3F|nr:membrane-spanning 4-domains subfamily A member 15-like [Notolabrus celidotus]